MSTPHPPALRLPHELTIYTAAETRTTWLAWLALLSDADAHADLDAQGPAEANAVGRVDGEDVDQVDAAGVQLLVALAHSLQRQHGTLQLCNASRPLRQACQDLGVAGLLLGTEAQATEAAGAPA